MLSLNDVWKWMFCLWVSAQVVLAWSFRMWPVGMWGMWGGHRSVAKAVCWATPTLSPSQYHWELSLLHPHHLCIWSWHPYLPQNGSSCILSIFEIDFTASTPPPRLPYLHMLLLTSPSAKIPFFSSCQPVNPTSSFCSVPLPPGSLLHQFPPCMPPLRPGRRWPTVME